jgi:hypothetical protein
MQRGLGNCALLVAYIVLNKKMILSYVDDPSFYNTKVATIHKGRWKIKVLE